MRLLALLLAGCATAHPAPPIADEWNPPGPAIDYPLAPTVRSASGGSILVNGVIVPYARGLTLRTALALAGTTRHTGTLVRGDQSYELPVGAIVGHLMPDPELAPGDVIVLHDELCATMEDHCD